MRRPEAAHAFFNRSSRLKTACTVAPHRKGRLNTCLQTKLKTTHTETPAMITVNTLRKMKADGEKIAMLTAYEASFAALMDEAGIDALLVGDSLGMTVQGHSSTLPVTLADMRYHTAAVARGAKNALIVADLPFGAYQQSREQAFAAAAELMAAGAHMVKLEGGTWMAATNFCNCAASPSAPTSASPPNPSTPSAATKCRAKPTAARHSWPTPKPTTPPARP